MGLLVDCVVTAGFGVCFSTQQKNVRGLRNVQHGSVSALLAADYILQHQIPARSCFVSFWPLISAESPEGNGGKLTHATHRFRVC